MSSRKPGPTLVGLAALDVSSSGTGTDGTAAAGGEGLAVCVAVLVMVEDLVMVMPRSSGISS